MKENKFAQNIVDTIKTKSIQPKPKWHFLLRDGVLWAVGGLALFIGAVAIAVIIFIIRTHDLEFYEYFEQSRLKVFVLAIPYVWIVLLGAFVWLADRQIRHTKHGYQYPLWTLALITFCLSCVLGIGLYYFGVAERIDESLARHTLYREYAQPQFQFLRSPEEGFLVGKILIVAGDHFVLRDLQGREWHVLVEESELPFLRDDIRVRVFGEQLDDSKFRATIVRPMNPSMRKTMPPHKPGFMREKIQKFNDLHKQEMEANVKSERIQE